MGIEGQQHDQAAAEPRAVDAPYGWETVILRRPRTEPDDPDACGNVFRGDELRDVMIKLVRFNGGMTDEDLIGAIDELSVMRIGETLLNQFLDGKMSATWNRDELALNYSVIK